MRTFYVAIMYCEKMAVIDMSFRQRKVIRFLVKEGNSKVALITSIQRPNDKARNVISPHRPPPKKKPKTVPSAGKITGTIFWDSEGCILIDFLENGETINAARYVQTLNKLRRALHEKRAKKKTVILQNDNARPHTARLTLQTIQRNGWELLSQPPCSPDFAPFKDHLRGHHHQTDEAVQEAV
jgi:hypothetical protein